MTTTPISYKDAGVDIDAGDALIERIKPLAKKTMREGVLAGIGGFGALFEVPKRYKEPVLVSGTDGVGTKLKLAFDMNKVCSQGQGGSHTNMCGVCTQCAGSPMHLAWHGACIVEAQTWSPVHISLWPITSHDHHEWKFERPDGRMAGGRPPSLCS